ncbi:MAG: hypothetical protein KKA62_03325 [Nanoarchaeota archaeon]|nr:hypothetical protein [Nanoarchaeota archaeon]MBU1976956.1 hypothetical protein [Nanoarchaeota archaeon]
MTSHTERFLYQLAHNLKAKAEVAPLVEQSQELKAKIDREGFEEVVADLNRNSEALGRPKFSVSFFDGSTIMPDIEIAANYSKKHTIYPVGIGVTLNPNQLGNGLAQEGFGDGIVIAGRELVGSTLGLDKTGFIIIQSGNGADIRAEHELLHVDNYSHSANHTMLKDFPDDYQFDPQSYLTRVENAVKAELIAYRNEIVGNLDRVMNDIVRGTVGMAISRGAAFVAATKYGHEDPKKLEEEIKPQLLQELTAMMYPLVVKIKPAGESMKYLTQEAPSQLLTPLLFSIGSTPEEINAGKVVSVLDDIVGLADSYSRRDLRIEQLYDGIKQKGYDL